MDQKQEVNKILNKVEASSVADISSILNEATERVTKGDMKLEDYKGILINIARRADSLAQDIYKKDAQDDQERQVDIEEYRTLLDISRECRDKLFEALLVRGFDKEIT